MNKYKYKCIQCGKEFKSRVAASIHSENCVEPRRLNWALPLWVIIMIGYSLAMLWAFFKFGLIGV